MIPVEGFSIWQRNILLVSQQAHLIAWLAQTTNLCEGWGQELLLPRLQDNLPVVYHYCISSLN